MQNVPLQCYSAEKSAANCFDYVCQSDESLSLYGQNQCDPGVDSLPKVIRPPTSVTAKPQLLGDPGQEFRSGNYFVNKWLKFGKSIN